MRETNGFPDKAKEAQVGSQRRDQFLHTEFATVYYYRQDFMWINDGLNVEIAVSASSKTPSKIEK